MPAQCGLLREGDVAAPQGPCCGLGLEPCPLLLQGHIRHPAPPLHRASILSEGILEPGLLGSHLRLVLLGPFLLPMRPVGCLGVHLHLAKPGHLGTLLLFQGLALLLGSVLLLQVPSSTVVSPPRRDSGPIR